ncbi:hypothetical protein SAMN05660642_04550 [Geodermatophilus siccatus]|uniref:Uncharacterized protein n=1 Tax=Geodermatophilus siccatus TaxID=1137991 RepID=A0A1H0ADC0_9ACTN|nr:hypothetical protein SAMN05660642_04550 [Geodermatophilus siccatus]
MQAVPDSVATPALVQDLHLDLVASNPLGRAIHPHIDGTRLAPLASRTAPTPQTRVAAETDA